MAGPEPPEFEITRRMIGAWNDGNIDRMPEFWTEDGDWIWEDAPEIPDARTVRGTDAVQAHLKDVMAVIGELELEIESLSMLGDAVVAELRFQVAGVKSGVRFGDDAYALIHYEDGRVRRYRMFTTRDQAVAAASS